MVSKKDKVVELENAVVRFAGDSGDGMQLTGSLFSDSTAFAGNDFATFPDYPAEIRAPQGTVAKAGYKTNPLKDGTLSGHTVIEAPITTLTKEAVKNLNIDNKSAQKSKNMFALGMVFYMFNRDYKKTFEFFEQKFKSNPLVVKANKQVLTAGYNYADTIEVFSRTYKIIPAPLSKGLYRNVTGNLATSWGLLAAAERSGRKLFLGSYPITPASEILQELSKHKQFGAIAFQAEDEIAGIVSSIGASYTGAMAVTSTSGPGLSLKSEAIGLAVMTELPLVIVNVQRGGPSTGLPTKSEQSDLMQALYGRNGEAPVIVMAAQSSADCFFSAYEAAKLAMEHMTPVILLTDGSLANGSEVFKIPDVGEMPPIKPPIVKANDPDYKPYKRDPEKLSRPWALPGTEGLRHRIGGLEKENITGNVSQDPMNHQKMSEIREEKVERVMNYIPELEVVGEEEGELLVVGWGGTYGVMLTTIEEMRKEGKKISLAHFKHIKPLPKNTEDVLKRFKKILVCEINLGQFVNYLRMSFPGITFDQFNKIQGLPFMVSELKEKFNEYLND